MVISFFGKLSIRFLLPWRFRAGGRYASSRRVEAAVVDEADADPDARFDAMEIAREQEGAMRDICGYLRCRPPRIVTVVVHNGSFECGGRAFRHGGFAHSPSMTIHCNLVPRRAIAGGFEYLGKHEMVHIVMAARFGPCASLLLGEGFANAIDGSYGRRRIEELFEGLRGAGRAASLEELFRAELPEGDFYPQSGVFVRWLIAKFGLEGALRMYVLGGVDPFPFDAVERAIGLPFADLCAAYDAELRRVQPGPGNGAAQAGDMRK